MKNIKSDNRGKSNNAILFTNGHKSPNLIQRAKVIHIRFAILHAHIQRENMGSGPLPKNLKSIRIRVSKQ